MKTIQFSVTDEEKAEYNEYAKVKGLHNASGLARFAMTQYIRKYPLNEKRGVDVQKLKSKHRAVQPEGLERGLKEV